MSALENDVSGDVFEYKHNSDSPFLSSSLQAALDLTLLWCRQPNAKTGSREILEGGRLRFVQKGLLS